MRSSISTDPQIQSRSDEQHCSCFGQLGPFLSPEDLAVALDDGNARRNWFLNLYIESHVAMIERGVSRVLAAHQIQDGMYRPALAKEGR